MTNDTLVTYINELGQRVYDIPVQVIDPTVIGKLRAVDSTYKELDRRIRAFDKKHKDLMASMALVLESEGTVSSTYVTNNYYSEDSTVYSKTFHYDDGLLDAYTTIPNTLDSIETSYKINLGKMYIDIFNKRRGILSRSEPLYDVYATFDNPKVNLLSQRVSVGLRPVPVVSITAGGGFAIVQHNKQLHWGPSLYLGAGIPLYTFYKHKR